MKLFPLMLVAAIATPQVASAHPRLRSGEFEVEPSHCAFDKTFESWNCWYRPAPKPEYGDYHHHHYGWVPRVPYFRPNEHNEHGVPCYIYKDDNWCF
tara:strand:- start:5481 stop:5771 length:291 start_codon:yes stop_codon:yes gene_type:complete